MGGFSIPASQPCGVLFFLLEGTGYRILPRRQKLGQLDGKDWNGKSWELLLGHLSFSCNDFGVSFYRILFRSKCGCRISN